jgi:hypothetical protein
MLPLYFGIHCGTGIVSSAIRWEEYAPEGVGASHISIIRPDGRLIEAWQGEGLTLLALRGKVQDVRTAAERLDADTLQLGCVLLDYEAWLAAMTFAQAQVGKSYDYLQVVRFVSRTREDRKTAGKWFCSELAYAAAEKGGMPLHAHTAPYEVSPPLFVRSTRLEYLNHAETRGEIALLPEYDRIARATMADIRGLPATVDWQTILTPALS